MGCDSCVFSGWVSDVTNYFLILWCSTCFVNTGYFITTVFSLSRAEFIGMFRCQSKIRLTTFLERRSVFELLDVEKLKPPFGRDGV